MSVDVKEWRGVASDSDAERTAAEAPDEKATIRLRAASRGLLRSLLSPHRRLLTAAERERFGTERPEAVGDLVGGEAGERIEGLDPEPAQRLDQLLSLTGRGAQTGSQRRDRDRSGPATGGEEGGKAGPPAGDGFLRAHRPASRREDTGRIAVEPPEAVEGEERLAVALGLDGGADRLQRPHHRLAQLSGFDRIKKVDAPGPRPPGTIRARRSRQALVDDADDLHTNVCSYSKKSNSIESTASSLDLFGLARPGDFRRLDAADVRRQRELDQIRQQRFQLL